MEEIAIHFKWVFAILYFLKESMFSVCAMGVL